MDRLADRSLSAALFTESSRDSLPARAGTIVVGGGIIGASIAHHLAANGVDDVLILERGVLTSGTSWHAAGLVAGARTRAAINAVEAAIAAGVPCVIGLHLEGPHLSLARKGVAELCDKQTAALKG
jgi:4-methylaminobutanoate oxidase (formaldehyde-forming)